MRLCTFAAGEEGPWFGLQVKTKLLRVSAAATAAKLRPAQRAHLESVQSFLDGWPHSEKVLRGLLQKIAEEPNVLASPPDDGVPFLVPMANARFLPPIERPGKILCVGLNYRDHCEEQNRPVPEFPMIFNKFATSLIGHEAEIPLPIKTDPQMDYEAELAFVIGKQAKKARKRAWDKHVAGYMIMNDVSARSLQARERQWARAKGFDGSGPCGPFLVTTDEIPDPHNLRVRCRLNGKVMQDSNTRHLVFNIGELIQHITEVITLEPGDIVSTGTPGGVGLYREPQVFLQPGDVVEIEVEGLGVLRNTCVKG